MVAGEDSAFSFTIRVQDARDNMASGTVIVIIQP